MNQGMIVRVEVDTEGVMLRLWIDDETGRHLAVAEVAIAPQDLYGWVGAYEEANYAAYQAEEAMFDA